MKLICTLSLALFALFLVADALPSNVQIKYKNYDSQDLSDEDQGRTVSRPLQPYPNQYQKHIKRGNSDSQQDDDSYDQSYKSYNQMNIRRQQNQYNRDQYQQNQWAYSGEDNKKVYDSDFERDLAKDLTMQLDQLYEKAQKSNNWMETQYQNQQPHEGSRMHRMREN